MVDLSGEVFIIFDWEYYVEKKICEVMVTKFKCCIERLLYEDGEWLQLTAGHRTPNN